jgi:hypothetical protein
VERGIAPPSYAIVETTGHRSGQPRRTPVGNGLDGDTFRIVAEHRQRAAYARNIEADPHGGNVGKNGRDADANGI